MTYKRLLILLLLMPQLVIIMLLIIGLIVGIIQSFGIIPALNLTDFTLEHYIRVFQNPNFIDSLKFTLKIAFVSAILSTIIGLFVVYIIINLPVKRERILRQVQIPIIIPYVIVALFVIIFFSRTGVLARILFNLGFDNAQNWFGTALFHPNGFGVITAYLWKGTPFIIFYCYPLIRSISHHYGEAARTLGANRLQVYLQIVLPLCRETIFSGFLILFMFAFGAYELPNLLGPTLPKSLAELAYIEYTHPDLLNRPYAMAINGVIIIFSLVSAVVYFAVSANGDKEEK